MKKRGEIAVAKFMEGFNCAQSVLYPFCDEVGIEENIALKSACGFGAGMGRKGKVCGAVSGGIIVIGLKHGRGENEDMAAVEKTYQKTQYLIDHFKERHRTIICRVLLKGCDLLTEKGQSFFKENELKNKKCEHCVQDVVEILEEIL